MSPITRFKRKIGKTEDSTRRESVRSSLRKQLFNERQMNAMKKWQQVAVVAWK